MNIEELLSIQDDFDSNYSSKFNWNEKITDDNVEVLQFLIIAALGELGEVANLTKKIARGDFLLSDMKSDLEDEVIDTLIYIVKICNQLGVDIENVYKRKLEYNRSRFDKYLK